MPTVLEVVTEVRDMIDEPIAAQWTDVQLKRWISEGMRDMARTTHHWKGTDTLTLTADVSEYTLPAEIIAVEHAYYDDLAGQQRPLLAKHYEQMDGIWGHRMGWTGAWPTFFSTWGHSPTLKLVLHPVPSVTGHLLRLLSSILPDVLGGDSSQVDVPPAYYDALSSYATYKAFLKDQNPIFETHRNEYVSKRDQLIHNNEYVSVAREMIPDPMSQFGYVVPWLADPGWV